ncbi:hypothetical protein N8508_00980 [bacterium]|nr:hypothetical protein [bacterium]
MELSELDQETQINILTEDMPGFLKWDMTVSQLFDLMMGDAHGYIQELDMDWLMLVYRIHHKEVIHWCDLPYGDLVDPDYCQQSVNFVMAATFNWVKKFCEAYAESGSHDKLAETVGTCKVFYLDRYKVRLH